MVIFQGREKKTENLTSTDHLDVESLEINESFVLQRSSKGRNEVRYN